MIHTFMINKEEEGLAGCQREVTIYTFINTQGSSLALEIPNTSTTTNT